MPKPFAHGTVRAWKRGNVMKHGEEWTKLAKDKPALLQPVPVVAASALGGNSYEAAAPFTPQMSDTLGAIASKIGPHTEALEAPLDEKAAFKVGTVRDWKVGKMLKTKEGWVPYVPAPVKAAPAKPPEKVGGVKGVLKSAWHTVTEPFVQAHKFATDKKYRAEVKSFLKKAIEKEAIQTKQLFGTLEKAISGKAISKKEKAEAIDQTVDLFKVAILGGAVAHLFAGGVLKALATLASPAEEVIGAALDKPIRAATLKFFGREHGLLPTAFYEGAETPESVLEHLFDAVLDELAKTPPDDVAIAQALATVGGVDPLKPDTYRAVLSPRFLPGK